jgi:hypothetical protein
VDRSRSGVTAEQKSRAVAVLPNLSEPGILELRKLRLPGFGMLTAAADSILRLADKV